MVDQESKDFEVSTLLPASIGSDSDLASAQLLASPVLSAKEMMEIPGFRDRISERQPNRYEPYNQELAEQQMDERNAAILACIIRAKKKKAL